MERQMDQEVERVFRNMDQNMGTKSKDIGHITPIRPSSSRHLLSPANLFHETFGHGLRKVLSIERLCEKDNVSLAGDDTGNNSSSESVEEDSRRPHYSTCSTSGRKMVRLQFDVQGFSSRDIKVKLCGRKLIIFALHREADSGRRSTTEFCRKIKLPDDVDVERLNCSYSDGILTAEGPVLTRDLSSHNLKQRLNVVKLEQLNTPLIRHTDMGKMMHMFVELGRIFRPDDVVVKLKGHDKLVITAQRQEDNPKDTLTACVTREFQLPERIYPHSLKAGLTHDGILNVTALVHQPSPVNGEATPVVTIAEPT